MAEGSEQIDASTAQALPRTPHLRPGAEILEVNEDRLHVAFANYTATFNSPMVVRGVKALIAAMDQGRDESTLIAQAAAEAALAEGFVRYILDMMEGAHCLYWSNVQDLAASPLDLYWGSIGEAPAMARAMLAATRPVVFTSARAAPFLKEALETAGIAASVTTLATGDAINRIAAAIEDGDGPPSLLLAWDLPYRSTAARAVNDLAMRGFATLFGSCEGVVGRIGPYILPGSTPCLACLNSRLLSNAAPEDAACATALRAREGERIGRPTPTHPVFLRAMTNLFVLEVSEIMLRRSPRSLGGLIEHDQAGGEARRRTILRGPRCSACSQATAPRFAWSASFVSPEVKGASHDV